MSKYREDSYIFCASLVRARENSFLTKSELEKVATASDMNQAMKLLAPYGYGDGEKLDNPRDFIGILSQVEEEAYTYAFSTLPDEKELELLRLTKDYHNAKAILKAEFMGIDTYGYLVKGSETDPSTLGEMIKDRNYAFLSPEMKEGIISTLEAFGKERNPQKIDIIMDKACYKEMLRKAEDLGNDFITGYVKLLIDNLNLMTMVRLRTMGKGWDFYQKVFLDGGNIAMNQLVAGYDEAYQQLAERLAPYGYGHVIEKASQKIASDNDFSVLEKLCDDKIVAYVRDSKFVTFGIEPVAAYLIAKDSEIKNLRMILSGKIIGTPIDVMKERMRETYV